MPNDGVSTAVGAEVTLVSEPATTSGANHTALAAGKPEAEHEATANEVAEAEDGAEGADTDEGPVFDSDPD